MLKRLERIQKDFNGAQTGGKKVSLADLIVLGGAAAAIETGREAARAERRRYPSRQAAADATQAQTDVASFAVLEPTADGFRNYFGEGNYALARRKCWWTGRTC